MRPLHLLSAFSSLDESLLVEVCDELGALSQVRERLRDAIAQVPTLGTASNDLRMSSELGRVLAVARTLAEKAGDRFVPEEWVLVGLLQDTELRQLLKPLGITPELD